MTANASDASELYDRQIRLWGLEAQQRIQSSKAVVCGLGGLGAEVAKNLVLAGLAVTVVDDGVCEEADLLSNFFLDAADVGRNRAEASLPRVQELNRLVAVAGRPDALDALPDSFFAGFNILVVSRAPLAQLRRLNALARAAGAAFVCGDVFGYEGCFFQDWGQHTFREESGSGENMVLSEPATIDFPSLDNALAVPFDALKNRFGPASPVYCHWRALLRFRERTSRTPVATDAAELNALAVDLLASNGGAELGFGEGDASVLASSARTELAPVAAILGGVVGQEVVKFVSGKGTPVENFFVLDAMAGDGRAFRAPPTARPKPPAAAPPPEEMECL